jgi:hypothetical protein
MHHVADAAASRVGYTIAVPRPSKAAPHKKPVNPEETVTQVIPAA